MNPIEFRWDVPGSGYEPQHDANGTSWLVPVQGSSSRQIRTEDQRPGLFREFALLGERLLRLETRPTLLSPLHAPIVEFANRYGNTLAHLTLSEDRALEANIEGR